MSKVYIGNGAGNCANDDNQEVIYGVPDHDVFTLELEKLMTKHKINHVCVYLDRIQKYVKEQEAGLD